MVSNWKCLLVFLFIPLCALAQPADTIYYNGKIVTLSERQPAAQAVAIRSGRFLAVGSSADVLKTAGPSTTKIDLRGKCILPGIIESHVHPIGAALSEIDGPIPVLHSLREIDDYIKTQAAKLPPGRLIFVPKVYSTRLEEHRYPDRYELDRSAPNREAMLDNGYASVLNSAKFRSVGDGPYVRGWILLP